MRNASKLIRKEQIYQGFVVKCVDVDGLPPAGSNTCVSPKALQNPHEECGFDPRTPDARRFHDAFRERAAQRSWPMRTTAVANRALLWGPGPNMRDRTRRHT
jgi:hypothetical protein